MDFVPLILLTMFLAWGSGQGSSICFRNYCKHFALWCSLSFFCIEEKVAVVCGCGG